MIITYEFLNEALEVLKTKQETKPDDEFDKEMMLLFWDMDHYGGKVENREYQNGIIKEITFLISMISPKELSRYMRITLKKDFIRF